jgi:hypothetical protein
MRPPPLFDASAVRVPHAKAELSGRLEILMGCCSGAHRRREVAYTLLQRRVARDAGSALIAALNPIRVVAFVDALTDFQIDKRALGYTLLLSMASADVRLGVHGRRTRGAS